MNNFFAARTLQRLLLLSILCIQLLNSIAQTTTPRLYLKSGNALSRVFPTSSTAQSTAALFKQTAVVTSSGSFATGNSGASTGSLSSSPTTFTPSGSNRLVLVTIGSLRTATNQVTSVTFGTNSLTKLSESVDANNRKIEYWYLINPATTAGSVTINWPAGQTLEAAVGVVLLSDIDIVDPFGPVASNTGSVSTSSLSVTSASGDIIIDAITRKDNSITVGTNQTQVFNAGTNSIDVSVSYKAATTGAATQTSMSWSSVSGSWATVGFSIKGNSNDVSFAQSASFCAPFTIKAGTNITVSAAATVSSGTAAGATLPMVVTLLQGTSELIELSSATNTNLGATGTTGTLTWTGQLVSDVTIQSGEALSLRLSSDYQAANIAVNFDATSAISYLELPTTTYLNIDQLQVYNGTYPGGALVTQQSANIPNYVRVTVSNPFGADDINGTTLSIAGGTPVNATLVHTNSCQKIYEYVWTPTSAASYSLAATAAALTDESFTKTSSSNFTIINSPISVVKTILSKSPASPTYTAVGDLITFNIAIKNEGVQNMVFVPLQDVFSTSCFQFVSASMPPTSIEAGKLGWHNVLLSPLAPGATLSLQVTLKVIGNCDPSQNDASIIGAKDAAGNIAPTVSSSVAVPVDAAPVGVADSFCIANATALTVLNNDTDPDDIGTLNNHTADYTVTIVNTPSKGTATVNADKTIQFDPTGMAENELVTFTYNVTDDGGLNSANVTITVRYSAINDNPSANDDVAGTTAEKPVIISVLTNDISPDGVLEKPVIKTKPKFGQVVVNDDKTITYIPNKGFDGVDEFEYEVCDPACPSPSGCDVAKVTVTVQSAIYVCQGSSSVVLSVPALSDAKGYTWTLPAGATITAGANTNSITVDFSAVTAGNYEVCAKATNECGESVNQCMPVVISKVELATVVTNVSCFGSKTGAVDLTVTGGIAPFTYSWTGPNGYAANIEDLTQLGAGSYSVTVTDKYGCTASTTVTITEPAAAIAVTGVVTNEDPYGNSNGAIDISVTGGTAGYTYQWSNGAATQDVTGLVGGSYTVVVTDANGCTATQRFTVDRIGGPLSVAYIAKTDVLCRNGNTGTIDLEIIGGVKNYSYQWTGPSTFTSSSADLTGLAAGTYNVIITDAAATAATLTLTVTIEQPAAVLSAVATGTNLTCNGADNGSVTLDVTGGTAPYNYQWSNGAVIKDITQLAPGTYDVLVTDANGCTTTASAVITQPAALVLTGAVVNSNCNPGNNGAIDISVSGGTGAYTYTWIGPNGFAASTDDLSNLAPGQYAVTVTDAAGCTAAAVFTVGNACIGLAKELMATPVNNNDGSYTLSYNLKVENKGNVLLNNVQVTDDLATAFTGATSFNVTGISSNFFTVNNSFNGSTDKNLISTAALGSLSPGASGNIQISITIIPGAKLGVYNNSADVTAKDPNGATVSDVSQDGSSTDPDANGNPGDNSVPTPVSFTENPVIGIAKAVTAGPVYNGDGTYNVTYSFKVQNMGDVPLKTVQVTDDLEATFGTDPVSVVSITSPDLTVNTSFNGKTDKNMLAGTDGMAVNAISTIVLVVKVTPSSAGPFNNTAVATAKGPGNTAVTDNSQDGANPDSDNDQDPSDNSDPTPVSFTENPSIGISKEVAGTPLNNNDGTYTLTYQFVVKNTGNVKLSNVQVADNLATVFAGKTIVVDYITTSANLTKSTNYTGSGVNTGLLSGNDELDPEESGTITLTITVTPGSNLGAYNNQATASGKSPFNTTVTDLSNDGADIDPENDGAGDNSIPTPVSFPEAPQIGVAKTVNNPVNNGDGTYSAVYTIKVTNTGNVPLSAVQVTDDLVTTFASAAGFSVNSISANGTLAANTSFNGNTDKNLLNAASSSLAVDATATITIGITITPGGVLGVYENTALASAVSPGGETVNDESMDGNEVDPDENKNPADNTVPTPLSFAENPKIAVAKTISAGPVANGNGTYDLTYRINVKNTGDVALTNVQLAEDLAATFPAPATATVKTVTIVTQPVSNNLLLNSGYNGNADVSVLNGAGTLQVNEFAVIDIAVTVNPGLVEGPYYNTAVATGNSPAGATVADESQDGTDADPDADGDAKDNNVPTPVIFELVSISGKVFNDEDGLNDNVVDGSGTNAGSLYANLVDPATNKVIASVAVGTDGTYLFTPADGVAPNTSYNIILTTTQQATNTVLTTAVIPAGWVSTGENLGTTPGADGTVNSILSVTTTTENLTDANFGIEELPSPGAGEYTTLNPGGNVKVILPATTFTNSTTSSDVAPGTVTAIRITSFPANATTVTINSVTYTSANFPAGGVIVPTDSLGNPTQTISVDPEGDGEVTVTIPFKAIDNAGKESLTEGTATVYFTTVLISGTVYNDADGLTDGNVDGTGTNAGDLYANLVDPATNKVIASVAVGTDGTYQFTATDGVLPSNTYNIVLTTSQQTVNQLLTAAALPSGWESTGEDCCDNAGDDGTVNSILSVTTGTTGASNANFGIEQLPTAGSGTHTTLNPGGTTSVSVPASTFTNTTASSDIAPGTVTAIRITEFPAGAASITIDGITYTSSTFPVGGVVVPTDAAGNPTKVISVDPASDAETSVTIPFKAIDNAGKESANTGTAVINFTTVLISGTVYNDADGLTDGNVDGTGTNAGDLYANLVDPATNKVIASVPVSTDGTYQFTATDGVLPSNTYNIVLTTSQQTVNQLLTAATLPVGWVSTGEDCCDNAGDDGTVNSILSVTTGTTGASNANFGIEQLPVAGSGENTTLNPGGTTSVTVPASTFTNTTASSDIAPGTVTAIRITAFPAGATSITIDGTTYTSSTFPVGGVVVPTDAAGNPTKVISVDPASDAETSVTIPFKAIDNAGKESANTGTAVINFTTVLISGTVYNDADGLTDGNVDGAGTNAGGLYANLVDPATNEVIASVPVSTDGTYLFTAADGVQPFTEYKIILSTTQTTAGNTVTAASLPKSWVVTGEDCCDQIGSDGAANGVLTVNTGETGVVNANFGIEQPPVAGAGFYTTYNPGGTNSVSVPPATFTNRTATSDVAPGIVSSIRITSFPVNATTLTINGTVYTSSNFPAEGVVVPTDADGNPTQAISVDPAGDGKVTVIIPFKAIDNAGKESENTGTAVIEFTPLIITGTVFNDPEGLTDGNVDGYGTNAGGLYANLVDPVTNEVIASVPVGSNGVYQFTVAEGVLPNTAYKIILTTAQQSAGNELTQATLPTGWASIGEDCCDNIGHDGTVNGVLSVLVGAENVSTANFGIEELPTAGSGMRSDNNPGGTIQLVVPASTFVNVTESSDAAPGYVTSIRITAFPVNVTSIVINGVTYTSSDFPAEGVVVPTDDNGNPTQVITVDPVDGIIQVTIPFRAIDNAGKESLNIGTAVITLATALPVTGFEVSGTLKGNTATVNWHTLQEWGTDYFEVERSIDNSNFVTVGRVAAAGVSYNLRRYALDDQLHNLAQVTVFYYRVKQVDKDGKFTYSKTITLRRELIEVVKVMPNPFVSELQLTVNVLQNTKVEFVLLDAYGKVIFKQAKQLLKGRNTMLFSGLEAIPQGAYFLRINYNETAKVLPLIKAAHKQF